jgi:predicted O-methyltransferase YrrM
MSSKTAEGQPHPEIWDRVDQYLTEHLLPQDEVLDAALRDSAMAGLPSIQVTPNQGKLLQLLVQLSGARRILEVGTLGGYSTIWLARALGPDGDLITLELDPAYAEVARKNIARANLSKAVEQRIGPALQSLPRLARENQVPFDFIFIDADKQGTTQYFEWALKLSRPGSVIVVDNVVRNGAVVETDSNDPRVQGMRRFHEMLGREGRVSATAIQTVGSKGYDGFALAVVKSTSL